MTMKVELTNAESDRLMRGLSGVSPYLTERTIDDLHRAVESIISSRLQGTAEAEKCR